MLDQQLLTFTVASTIIAITPGNDTILTMKNSLAGGQRTGFATTFGIICGCLVHASFSALGISMILVKSALLFDTVKLIGAAYLVYLGGRGLWALWRTRKSDDENPVVDDRDGSTKTPSRAFIEGLLTNIFNPKVAIFYLSFLPQFISPNDPVLGRSFLLAGIHQLVGTLWLSCVVIFVSRLKTVISRSKVRRKLEALTGAVLIAFGVRLALEQR